MAICFALPLNHRQRGRDKDVLCPCDYRDADVLEYGSCYCGLYLSEQEAANHKKEIVVPERRPLEKMFLKNNCFKLLENKPEQRFGAVKTDASF